MTGGLDVAPLVLVAIIFLWTPPHFWALSLYRADDYKRARVPMLPVVAGKPETRKQILIYSLVLFVAGLLPVALGFAGALYLAASAGLGAWFVMLAVGVYRERDAAREPNARKLFAVSILYLFALFAALILERAIALAPLSQIVAG